MPWSPTLSIACAAVTWEVTEVSEVTSPAAGSAKDAPEMPPRAETGASGEGGGGGKKDAGLKAAASSATCQWAHCQVMDDQVYTNGEQVEGGGGRPKAPAGVPLHNARWFTKVTEGQKRKGIEKQNKKGVKTHTCCSGAEVCPCSSPA